MSEYTIKLKDILHQLYLNNKYTQKELYENQYDFGKIYETTNPIEIVEIARPGIFDFEYPLYDITHKEELEKKILYHYYNYEIGEDTYGAFKFNLNKTLNEIMPYYNKIYKATAKDYDFDINIDYYDEYKGKGTQEASSNSQNKLDTTITDNQHDDYHDRLRKSDTPQNNLQEVEDGKYISEYNYNTGKNDSNKTNTTKSENNANDTSIGKTETENKRILYGTNIRTSRAEMLKQYISAIQNVDLQIIESLKSCFCLLL